MNESRDTLPAPDEIVPKKYRRHVVQLVTLVAILTGMAIYAPSWSSAGLIMWQMVLPLIAVSLGFYGAWWGIFDYPEADQQTLMRKAGEGMLSAAIAACIKPFVFAAIVWAVITGARPANAAERVDKVPPQAHQHLPMIRAELAALWPDMPEPAYVAALIHHESGCPALRSCWSPQARLKTHREEGAGWPQLTRAWRPDGSLRFDVVAELREKHGAVLSELSWSNVYQRPDLQVRAMGLMLHDLYVRCVGDVPIVARLDFVDPAYNGGCGGVRKERMLAKAAGADPNVWWGHVELHCSKSKAPLYGTRSACDINRHHVVAVRRHAQPAYEALL